MNFIKFHPGEGEPFLYLIIDRNGEFPVTIPMDLCTIFQYLWASDHGKDGSGIIDFLHDTPYIDHRYEAGLDEIPAKRNLYNALIKDSFALERANANKNANEKLYTLLEEFYSSFEPSPYSVPLRDFPKSDLQQLNNLKTEIISIINDNSTIQIPNYKYFWSHSKTINALHGVDWKFHGLEDIKNFFVTKEGFLIIPDYHQLDSDSLLEYAYILNTLYFKGIIEWYEIPHYFRKKFKFRRNIVSVIKEKRNQSPFHRGLFNCRIKAIQVEGNANGETLDDNEWLATMTDYLKYVAHYQAQRRYGNLLTNLIEQNIDTFDEGDFGAYFCSSNVRSIYTMVDENGDEILPRIYTNIADQKPGGLMRLSRDFIENMDEYSLSDLNSDIVTLEGDIIEGCEDMHFQSAQQYWCYELWPHGNVELQKKIIRNNIFEKDSFAIKITYVWSDLMDRKDATPFGRI